MPELGEINLGPGNEPAQSGPARPELAQLLNREANQAFAALDQEFSNKYQQLNKMYDWSRYEKDPTEIDRLRDRLERDIDTKRQTIVGGVKGALSKFKMLDELFAHDPEQANRLKHEIAFGKDIARAMFQKPADPREEHRKILAEQTRLLNVVKKFVVGKDGELYQAKLDEDDYYTDQPDRGKPASRQESQLWISSAQALGALDQTELAITQQMTDQGIEDPHRLESLLVSSEKEHWAKRYLKGWYGKYTMPGMMYKGITDIKKTFGPEPSGTFAQKVQGSMPKPQTQRSRTQRPSAGKKLTKKIAMSYLMQHGSRQEAMAAAKLDGYTE